MQNNAQRQEGFTENFTGQTETRRLIMAIVKYTADAPTHSDLSTIHLLARSLLETYDSERVNRLFGKT